MRREYGITVRGVIKAAREVNTESPSLTPNDEDGEFVLAVAAKLAATAQELEVGSPADWDWDAILKFLEGLVPLIMTIIQMFIQPVGQQPRSR